VVEPGRRCLGDRYELHQLIAAGGMGQVWRGEDLALHRPVAVKVLRSEYTGDPTFLARFRAEAQNAASLSHPNIAAVFDYGEVTAQDGTGETLAYLVMELVAGEPLSALLAREGALDTATTLSVLRQTGFALGEAHRAGMVHRDVKPGNILVCPDGHVKITDFGIAWSARSVALTRTGQVIGTPQYLSPEQAEGRLATPASDVYGLGLIGYECLSGRPAFEGDNPVTLALKQVRENPEPLPAQLPAGVRTLVTRALAKDPAARFVDGAAFVAAVEDVLSGREVPPAPATLTVDVPMAVVPLPAAAAEDARPTRVTGAGRRAPAPRRRNRLAMVLLPLLGLLAGVGIAFALLQALTSATPSSPAAAAEQRTGESIVLDAKDYIGRPVDEVATQLAAFGLTVDRRAQEAPDAVPGMVTDVRPAGTELSAGDTVAVYFAESGSDGSSSGGGGGGVTGAAVDVGVATSGSEAPGTGSESSAAPSESESSATPTLAASPTTSEATETTVPEDSTSSEPTTTPPSDTTSSATATDTTTPASSAPSSAKK
jgi:hypothetical protein